MQTIPDAPWIREAERYGVQEPPPAHCPICGEETDYYYLDQNGDIIGCDYCVRHVDVDTYRINR